MITRSVFFDDGQYCWRVTENDRAQRRERTSKEGWDDIVDAEKNKDRVDLTWYEWESY